MPAPRKTAVVALLVAAAVAVPAPVQAAPAGGAAWSVQPSSRTGPGNRPFFTYDLAPGAAVTDYVAVTNLGTSPQTFTVYASDAFTTATGGYDLLPADRPAADAGSWIRLGRRIVTVPPRSRADIPFSLTVPPNATPGDHAAGIVAAVTATSATAAGQTTRLEQRVGARVYLRVTGHLRPGLRVDGLRAAYRPGAVPFAGRLELSYTVRNTGNTRIAPGQQAAVTGLFGLPVGSTTLDPLPELLPGAALERHATVSGPALLRLTAAVSLTGAPARSTVTVWAPSWYYLLLLLLPAAIWLLRRRRPAPEDSTDPPAEADR